MGIRGAFFFSFELGLQSMRRQICCGTLLARAVWGAPVFPSAEDSKILTQLLRMEKDTADSVMAT